MSEGSSDGGFWSNAEARVDFPEDGWPRIRTCLAGIDLDRDTESKIEDHRS